MGVILNRKTKKWIIKGKYTDSNKKRVDYYKQTQFTSKKQAQEYDRKYKEELENATIDIGELKLLDLLEMFRNSKKFANSSHLHLNNLSKKLQVNNHNYFVNKLNVNVVNKISVTLTNANIRNLKSILNFGYKYRFVKEKYADFIIKKTKKEKKKIVLFDKKQLIENAHTFPGTNVELNDIMLFLLDSGLRINECLSITFDRVMEDHIVIDRQLIYNIYDKEWQWSTLKSKASYRKIPITKQMQKIIDKQPYLEDGFLFGAAKYMKQNNVQKYIAKIYNTHAHALRHTHASMLIEYSYDVLGYCDKDNIAQHMGHDVKELERTYKHLFRDKKNEILEVLEYINKEDM